MKKSDWRYRLLKWWAVRICKIPFTVEFTPPDQDELYATGFAWSPAAANRMRGDDMLIERLQRAENAARVAGGSRKARRMMNAAAKRAAKKELKS